MGFSQKIETKAGIIGVWELTESSEEMAEMFIFSEKEKDRFSKLKIEKRKKEFLAVRLLLAKLIGKKTELSYGTQGNPILTGSNFHISISHSNELATVFLSEKTGGIDTENINRDTEKIATRFLHSYERKFIKNEPDPALARVVYWAAKEAIYKCALEKEVEFNSQIVVQPFHVKPKGSFRGTLNTLAKSVSFTLWYFFFGNNVVVYCVEDKNF